MNSVKWACSPWVLLPQWIEHPPSVHEVMGRFLLETQIFTLSHALLMLIRPLFTFHHRGQNSPSVFNYYWYPITNILHVQCDFWNRSHTHNENQPEGRTETIESNKIQIQPIKCPVQNNEISICLLTSDVYATTVSVKCQVQTCSTFMCLRR